MPSYSWKRFWCPREGTYRLSDSGYLYDPDSTYGADFNPHVAPLTRFAECPCLVMLGEPGMGKSTESEAEFTRVVDAAAGSGDFAVKIDLKEYQTDGTLIAAAFESDTIRHWQGGQQTLHLFFDSLDEGRLEIRNIASVLARQLQRLKPHADRLRLRVACRTADWPQSLESTLEDLWPAAESSVIELVPLRQSDVVMAAEAEGLDARQFLDDVRNANVQPLAINPITLRFLIEVHRNTGRLPSSKRELYEAGCRRLCEELSQTRREAGHFGHRSPDERFEIASRIAAVSVFCGITAISTEAGHPSVVGQVSIADLAGGTELVRDDRFPVSESDIRDVLSTPLFSGRGPGMLGFAHRTYAEFLAVRYLSRRKVDAIQVGSLLFHPEFPTQVVPQLVETAAWAALDNPAVLERLLSGDPQILLRSDVAMADEVLKEQLVNQLLSGFLSGELDDSDWGLRDHYRKLSHSKLAGQLDPVIRDKSKDVITRRFVIDVAEACQATSLLPTLLAVALDVTDDNHVRTQAVYAIVRIGDDDARRKLIPLALGQAGPDPDDELRGSALEGVWPKRFISAATLFGSLIRPQRQSLAGAYRFFLRQTLLEHLQPNDLVPAMRWCVSHLNDAHEIDDFEDVRVAILNRGLDHLDESGIRQALVDYVAARTRQYEEFEFDAAVFESLGPTTRRQVAVEVIRKLGDPSEHRSWLNDCQPPLIREDDLDWLFERSAFSTDEREQRMWAQLARCTFDIRKQPQVDTVLAACQSNSVAATVFADWIESVPLDSEAATEGRERLAMHLEREARIRERREGSLLEPPPEIRVQECLTRFEAGSLDAYWHLDHELQLEPRSRHYLHDLDDDPTQFPGWVAANDETRGHIISAAQQYLLKWQPCSNDWIGTLTVHFPDFAGYRALVLVERVEPSFLDTLPSARWAALAPVVLGFPVSSGGGDQSESRQQRYVQAAFTHAPSETIAALLTMIDRENAVPGEVRRLHLLRRVQLCESPQLEEALLSKSADSCLSPEFVGAILEDLIRRGNAGARESAMALVAARETDRDRALAFEAATSLWIDIDDAVWDSVWPEFLNDKEFFCKVVTAVAYERGRLRRPPGGLSSDRLAELFVLLSQQVPHGQDPQHDGVGFLGPRDAIAHYRDETLAMLRDRGTPDAYAAVERIRAALPDLRWLGMTARRARNTTMLATWKPLAPGRLRELTQRSGGRLVRDGSELQSVILESLNRLQQRLHAETPAVRDIWDHNRENDTWEPLDENAFSDYVARHFRQDVATCGIIALREVEIRCGNGGAGERTDIYVAAAIHGEVPGEYDTVRVIVEVKGCWNRDLQIAIENQLKGRYLKENDCRHGVYLVGWFVCEAWNATDSRRTSTPKWTIDEARGKFESQAQTASDDSDRIVAYVLNTALA